MIARRTPARCDWPTLPTHRRSSERPPRSTGSDRPKLCRGIAPPTRECAPAGSQDRWRRPQGSWRREPRTARPGAATSARVQAHFVSPDSPVVPPPVRHWRRPTHRARLGAVAGKPRTARPLHRVCSCPDTRRVLRPRPTPRRAAATCPHLLNQRVPRPHPARR